MARDGEVRVSLTSKADVKGIKQTEHELNRLEKTNKKVSASNDQVAKSGKNTSLAFLEVSRAVEDAQYGFRGVINNIPQIITLFGGGAGLAAVVSLASVAFATLLGRTEGANKSLDKFKETVGSLNDNELKTYNDNLKRQDTYDAFTKNLADARMSVSDFSGALKDQFAIQKQIDDLERSRREAQAERDIAAIQASDLPASEKLSKEAAIRAQLSAERNQAAIKLIEQEVSINDQILIEKNKELQENLKLIETIEQNRFSEEQILKLRKSAEAAQARFTQGVEEASQRARDAGFNQVSNAAGGAGQFDLFTSILSRRFDLARQLESDIGRNDVKATTATLKEIAALRPDVETLRDSIKQAGLSLGTQDAFSDIFGLIGSAESAVVNRQRQQDQTQFAKEQETRLKSQVDAGKEAAEAVKALKKEVQELSKSLVELEIRRRGISEIAQIKTQTQEITSNAQIERERRKEAVEREKKRIEAEKRAAQQSAGLSSQFASVGSDPLLRGTAQGKVVDAASKALADGTTLAEVSKIISDLEKTNREANLAVIRSLTQSLQDKKMQLKKIQDLEYQLKNSNK